MTAQAQTEAGGAAQAEIPTGSTGAENGNRISEDEEDEQVTDEEVIHQVLPKMAGYLAVPAAVLIPQLKSYVSEDLWPRLPEFLRQFKGELRVNSEEPA